MASDISSMISKIQDTASSLIPNDDSLRQSLLQSARQLINSIETPAEKLYRKTYAEPLTLAATRTLIDLEVFKILSQCDGSQTVSQLAKTTNADAKLLSRLLKHVATEDIIKEVGADKYTANELSRTLASAGGEGTVVFLFDVFMKAADALPAHLKETGYSNPTDNTNTAWNKATGSKQCSFEWLYSPGQEKIAEAFRNHMAYRDSEKRWFEDQSIINAIFDLAALTENGVLMVDVGGSTGHDIAAFKQGYPSLTGRFISQDLPTTIQNIDTKALSSQGVEAMEHDFFTPQPIQHARAYFLKRIIHDWPEDKCELILANLKSAMKPGYSRILINEIVIPETGAQLLETGTDMLMMSGLAAQERREYEWHDLVNKVPGLKITKIWDIAGVFDKVIEIELEAKA